MNNIKQAINNQVNKKTYAKVYVLDSGKYIGTYLMSVQKLLSLAQRGRVKSNGKAVIVEVGV